MAQLEDELYVHVFIDHVDPDPTAVVEQVRPLAGEMGPVRFAARYVGSFLAYIALDVAEPGAFERVQALIADDLWRAGVRSQYSTEIGRRALGPHRGSPIPDFCALVRIRSSDPFALVEALDAWWDSTGYEPGDEHWYGSAVVTGKDVDVLLDLHEPSFDALTRLVLQVIRGEDEPARRVRELIISTDTSFAFLPNNAVRRETGS